MLWAMNLHVLRRPSLQRVIFGGKKESIAKVAMATVDKKRWIFKGIFAAIRGSKNRIFFMILLKFGRLGLSIIIIR